MKSNWAVLPLVIGAFLLACSSDNPGEPAGSDASIDSGSGVDDCAQKPDFALCELITEPDRSFDICVAGECVSPGCGDISCNTPGPHFALADTNERVCYSDAEEVDCPEEGEDFYGGDANYGWDVEHSAQERFTSDLSDQEHPIVADNATGLTWQGCALGYTGADCGQSASKTSFAWAEALVECDALEWGDFDDWRLPDEYELESLLDFGVVNPSISLAAFPNTDSTEFWSSSSYAGSPTRATNIAFEYGLLSATDKTYQYSARCVRGEPATSPNRFVRATDKEDEPTVIDNPTGLEWQGCVGGVSGEHCTLGTALESTWAEALAYCENLSYGERDDWRLPNRKELASIVDNGKFAPAIDLVVFPETPIGPYYWTSSSYLFSPGNGWRVDFENGHINVNGKSSEDFVRCVRDKNN